MGFNVFGVGIYVAYELKYMPEYESKSQPMVAVVCLLSIFLILLSIFGCIGALSKNPWLLGVVS